MPLRLTLRNFVPAGYVDLLCLFLIFSSLWNGERTNVVLLVCALRISMAIDGNNGDGLRSVMAHIYSALMRYLEGRPGGGHGDPSRESERKDTGAES